MKGRFNSLQLSTHFQRLVMWFPAFFSGYFLSCFSSSSSSSCLVSSTSHAEPKSVRHLLCSVPKITWWAVDTTPAQQLVWTGSCWKVQLPAARTPRSFLLKINSWDADMRPHGAELISPQSPEELNTVRNYQPPFSEVRAWFQGQQMPSDCWAQTSSFSAQDFGRLLYHALYNFSVSSDHYSHICQGHEIIKQIWVGLEKAGTCSYSPSWPDPVQVPQTVWGTPPLQSADWWRDFHKVSGSLRAGDLLGAKSRPDVGSGVQPSPAPSLKAAWQVVQHQFWFTASPFLTSVSACFSLGWLDWLARLKDCEGQWRPAYVCPAFVTNDDLMNRS